MRENAFENKEVHPMTERERIALVLIPAGCKDRLADHVQSYLPFRGDGWTIVQVRVADYEEASAEVTRNPPDLLFADSAVPCEIITALEPIVLPGAEYVNEHVIEATRAWADARRLMSIRGQNAESSLRYRTLVTCLERMASASERISRCRDTEHDELALSWLQGSLEDEIYKLTTNHLMAGSYPVRGTFLGVADVLRLDRYTRLVSPAAWEHVLASASHLFFSVRVLDPERRQAKLTRGDETYNVYCM